MCSNRQTGWALSWNCRLVPAWNTWKAQLWQQACILEISDYSPNTTTTSSMIMIRFVILVKSSMELQTLGKLGILGMLAWFDLCNIELLLNCSVCPRHKIQIYEFAKEHKNVLRHGRVAPFMISCRIKSGMKLSKRHGVIWNSWEHIKCTMCTYLENISVRITENIANHLHNHHHHHHHYCHHHYCHHHH